MSSDYSDHNLRSNDKECRVFALYFMKKFLIGGKTSVGIRVQTKMQR